MPRQLRNLIFFTLAAGLGFALLEHPRTVSAHESEQYTLPVGRDFADLGPYFSRIVYDSIVAAVAQTNSAIEAAVESGEPGQEIERLQSEDTIAGNVWAKMFAAIPTNELLDATLISESVKDQYPGLVTMYRPVASIYDDPLLVIDLTKAVRTFFRAGTVSAGGTIFGTDKIIHFINVGRIYHAKYETRIKRGMSPEDAVKSAIASTSRNPLTSEDGVLGMWSTGIVSNGDLAADYAGLEFYRNLTEEVRIGPRVLPPMLLRDGRIWKVAIRPDSDFFTVFITPHWNEVLNPNRFARYTSGRMRTLVRQRCPDALDRYRDPRGQRMGKAQFEAMERDFSTYFGESYEYEKPKSPVSIASVCFADSDGQAGSGPQLNATEAGDVDDLGRTELWWAARSGDVKLVQQLGTRGSELDTPDHDGETPLHAAVRADDAAVVQQLLTLGAKTESTALYGITPLMLAASGGRTEIVALLLQAGAMPNTRDLFGQTPLHQVVLRGNVKLTMMLLDHGADLRIADDSGNTALHLAARSGNETIVAALLARGGNLRDRNAAGATPREVAKRQGHARAAQLLSESPRSLAGSNPGRNAGDAAIASGASDREPQSSAAASMPVSDQR